jgi:hypothetical protein
VRVVFWKPSEQHRLCAWQATRGKRTIVPGSVMAAGAGLPHDLTQYVIEAATGYRYGFWGLVADGATFKSTGRRRTKPGRAVIAAHRAELDQSERLAASHAEQWRRGERTPVTEALEAALAQWRALGLDEELAFAWPEPRGVVRARGEVAGRR